MQNSPTTATTKTCPYLGLKDDPGSLLGNPSPGNYCYHCKFPASPLSIHQETYCLVEKYPECPVYTQDEKKPFPDSLQGTGGSFDFQSSKPRINYWILIGIGLLMVLGWFSYQFLRTGRLNIPFMRQISPTSVIIPTATNTPTLALPTATLVLPTKTLIPTATHTSSPTPLPPQRHALEVPVIVNKQEYLIHRVMDGDGFDYLAKTYKTSVEVIRAINYLLPPAIWVNLPIVVSPGVTAVDPTLPALQAYEVFNDTISLDDLAVKLKVDAKLLRLFNNCPDGCTLAKGDWIIVPHTK